MAVGAPRSSRVLRFASGDFDVLEDLRYERVRGSAPLAGSAYLRHELAMGGGAAPGGLGRRRRLARCHLAASPRTAAYFHAPKNVPFSLFGPEFRDVKLPHLCKQAFCTPFAIFPIPRVSLLVLYAPEEGRFFFTALKGSFVSLPLP